MSTWASHGGWSGVLTALTAGHDLDRDTAHAALGEILAGSATPAQIAGFVVALRQKGETVEEMAGMVDAMLDAATPLSVPDDAIDIVGTGGAPSRRQHALNASTISCFVAAGAGAIVCKHGNRKASSTSGSFDLLDELGIPDDVTPADLERVVGEVGIGFAFARTFHPAMRFAAPVRAELGIPTVFNLLGPLSNPGRVTRQVIGTPTWDLAPRMIHVLEATGSTHAMIVHGHGGLDELTVSGPSRILELRDGSVDESEIDAADFGLNRCEMSDLAGGTPAENAELARRILGGEAGARRDLVVLNAGAGLVVAGIADELAEGVARAQTAIDDGSAWAKVEALVAALSG
jgi:anthranilate phosphoribosyltransferase